jgi:hypothetical protein
MKKLLTLVASASIAFSCANAAIIFNPANPLNVVDQGGFTGSVTGATNPFDQALVRFTFTGLNPNPLLSSFQISGISLKGDGITTSLSFSPITITENKSEVTSFVSLNSPISNLDFANSFVSFNLPGGDVINDGAQFTVTVRYRNSAEGDQFTSNTGPIFEAQSAAPIPEPGTWAAAALLVGGAAFARWRKRKSA